VVQLNTWEAAVKRWRELHAADPDQQKPKGIEIAARPLLDSRTFKRYKCRMMRVEGNSREFQKALADIRKRGDDPMHWNPSQRALWAAEFVGTRHGGKRRHKGADLGVIWTTSHEFIAKSVGVSPRLVRMGVRLQRSGDAKLIEKVREGEMRLTAANQVLSMREELKKKRATKRKGSAKKRRRR